MSVHKSLFVATIQGATASGKSNFALELAQSLNTEIISADSRQIYKFMDIGTAKPSLQDRKKVQHHLIDIITPDQYYNAGKFARAAGSIASGLNDKGKIPLIVGGTGFYIKSLLEGLAVIPEIPGNIKKDLIKKHQEKNNQQLYDYLTSVDPAAASRINFQDRQKLLRAISVYEFTGQPISSYWQQQKPETNVHSYNILITRDRELLYRKIEERIDRMLESGLLNEIEDLLNKGYKKKDPGMRSVGYQEFIPYFQKGADLKQCLELAKQHTRNYAKRQLTWLKKIEFDLTLDASSINFSQIFRDIEDSLRRTYDSCYS
jgi:tRNA dimethylallyltransferase